MENTLQQLIASTEVTNLSEFYVDEFETTDISGGDEINITDFDDLKEACAYINQNKLDIEKILIRTQNEEETQEIHLSFKDGEWGVDVYNTYQ